MKNFKKVAILMAVLMVVCVIAAACNKPENLKGVTEDTIWVGNTAGTTGSLAAIGGPFNLGIEAAFSVYNKDGGFKGKQVKLKHYDDNGDAATSKTLTEQLLNDDEVFAIVGNFAATCVAANLSSIKEAKAPMVYAAAGNDVLLNENAKGADKYIMPVQPLNKTEGRAMLLRAFAPEANGGLAATKVGVLSNTGEASKSMLAGIKAEANNLTATQKSNIVYQEVSSNDYSAAVGAFKNQNCDLVIVALVAQDFLAALKAMDNANYYPTSVLTSYNNANAAYFNDDNSLLNTEYKNILEKSAIYAQAWLDITSKTYFYNKDNELCNSYKGLPTYVEGFGVYGFNEEYWGIAEAIYDYAKSIGNDAATAFKMSYNSYALAGYIAGDLFCQGLKALDKADKELTRANYVDIMETTDLHVAMADKISYANGMRAGVETFALNKFGILSYDVSGFTVSTANMSIVSGLKGIDELRTAVK